MEGMVRQVGLWAAALATVLLASCAIDHHVAGTAAIGKVQGVFVEGYHGVFVDRHMGTDAGGKPLWVYVTFDHPLADGRTFATAILPEDPGVEAGDLVQLRFAVDDAPETGSPPAPNQVVALIAKHDTAQARAFGSPETHALNQLRDAAADARP